MRTARPTATAVLAALAVVAALGPARAANLPIVDASIAFHGGELYESSRIAFTIVSGSGAFEVEIEHDRGLYRHAVTSQTDDGARTVVATNDEVGFTLDGEPQPVSAELAPRLRRHVSARVYFPLLPYRLADPSVRQADLGLETWPPATAGEAAKSRELHKVKVTFDRQGSATDDSEYLFWFDPDTGRLEQYAYSFDGGLRLRRAIRFARVGGILFSDQENLGIDWDDDEAALPVEVIDPEFVAQRMRPVSTVRLEQIEVEPLD